MVNYQSKNSILEHFEYYDRRQANYESLLGGTFEGGFGGNNNGSNPTMGFEGNNMNNFVDNNIENRNVENNETDLRDGNNVRAFVNQNLPENVGLQNA